MTAIAVDSKVYEKLLTKAKTFDMIMEEGKIIDWVGDDMAKAKILGTLRAACYITGIEPIKAPWGDKNESKVN